MNSVRSNYLSLKYPSYTLSGCKDIGIRKFKFVAKTQFLCYCIICCCWLLPKGLYIFDEKVSPLLIITDKGLKGSVVNQTL